MKKLLAAAVLLTALFAAQNANGHKKAQQTNENTFVLAQTENNNFDGLEIAITSVPTNSTVNSEVMASGGCIDKGDVTEMSGSGYYQIKISNTCSSSKKFKITYTSTSNKSITLEYTINGNTSNNYPCGKSSSKSDVTVVES
jgi:hypothetical protein